MNYTVNVKYIVSCFARALLVLRMSIGPCFSIAYLTLYISYLIMSGLQGSNRNREIYQLWMTIQDIIGPANLWPRKIRRYYWTPNLIHFERILICTFVYVNGLNPEIFFEWVALLNLGRDRAANRHFNALFRLFEAGRNYTLYAYNVTRNRYEYLNGTVHIYTHKSKRK